MDDTNYPVEAPKVTDVYVFPHAREELESFLKDWDGTTPEHYVEKYLEGWLTYNSRKFKGTRLDVGIPFFEQRRLRNNEKAFLRNFVLQICLYNGLSFYGTYHETLLRNSIYVITEGDEDTIKLVACTKKDAVEFNMNILKVINQFIMLTRNSIN